VLYALKALAALRHSEASGLRWLHDLPVAGALRRGREAQDPKEHRWGHETGSQRPTSSHPGLDGEPRSLATGLATAQRNWRKRWRKSATPAGFEPGLRIARNIKRCADLRCDPQVLRESRWGRERTLENARNPVIAVQMGPRWARDSSREVHCWTAHQSCFSGGGAKRCPVQRSAGRCPRHSCEDARLVWSETVQPSGEAGRGGHPKLHAGLPRAVPQA
jgi:hypothetical protein